LHDSISYRGYNLVCNVCQYKIRRVLGIDNVQSLIQNVGKYRDQENGENKT